MDGASFSNPTSRRTLLKVGLNAGLGVAAASALAPAASARTAAAYYKAVFDERLEKARAFAAGAAERHIATAAIRGDITRLFFDDLDVRWKQGPVLLAGYTLPASLFCLDLLARDRGMRVTHCLANPDAETALRILHDNLLSRGAPVQMPSGPVFWIIAPGKRR